MLILLPHRELRSWNIESKKELFVSGAEKKMRLVTHLSPGVFNAVKFVILYILVDNILVWSRAKLKRAVYAADLIHGVPVPIASITDNNGRNTIVDIYYTFKDAFAIWMSGCATDVGANPSLLGKSICRTCSIAAIRLAPLLILIFVFLS